MFFSKRPKQRLPKKDLPFGIQEPSLAGGKNAEETLARLQRILDERVQELNKQKPEK